jgi:uncharacterized protein YggU (UPF0235/DUF167 family)
MAAVAPASAIVPRADGVRLRVRLTPRAARDALGRLERLADGNEVMIAHVRALPADGEANAALVALVAKALGVARTKVDVVSGHTSRVKILHVEGDGADLAAALDRSAAAAK